MWQSNLFRFSTENAMGMLLVFDGGGLILYANRTARDQLAYEEGRLNGCFITDVFPQVFEIQNGQLEMKGAMHEDVFHAVAYRENHTCFPVRARVCVYDNHDIPGAGGRVYLCSAYNVLAEELLEKKSKQAEAETEQALKVKTEFVANVTHELRTPVNGILGNTRELIERETDASKLKLLHMMERGCNDMHALINNILDFSKLEAGKFVLDPREFNFTNMIEYVKGNHYNKIVEKGLNFSVNISPDVPEVVIGDELRIVQVLNNLISNACKFTSVGGVHVDVVKTAQVGNQIELFFMVIDNGIGIAKADQDKLFKSFSQVDASISRRYGGTGLGLNICKQLIELMNGHIHVESEAGKGSVFSFHIWVGVPDAGDGVGGAQEGANTLDERREVLHKLQGLTEEQGVASVKAYGTEENTRELQKKMSKLILSVEMDNWEKAEMFAEAVRQLTEEAPREVKTGVLRLKMAIQKGDYEKVTAAFETLQSLL